MAVAERMNGLQRIKEYKSKEIYRIQSVLKPYNIDASVRASAYSDTRTRIRTQNTNIVR